jgi:tetratricopeptide (TPR) repeat protein
MLSASASNDLAVLIDRLITAENIPARENLTQQVKELRERSVLVAIADAVNRMAREDLRRAEHLAEAACWVAERSGDLFSQARTRRASGNLQVLRGKYVDAIQTFQACAEQFATIGEEIEVAATLSTSLLPLMYLSRYSEALERARQAREIAERRQDNLLLARLDINVGNILHRQDRFPEAILHYERSLATLDHLGEKRDCVIAWLDLAVCHIAVNDFFRAEDAYNNARELALSENMTSIAAEADYNIAYLYYRRGDYLQAMRLYQQTRQYSQRVADYYMSALCDLDQAEMYLDLHLNREGTQLAQRALDAFETMDMGYEAAKAVVWLGIGAHQNRRPFEALDVFTKARQRMEHQQNAVWVALLDFYRAIILKQEGRFNEAHPEYGWAILRIIPGFKPASLLVLHHHERMDGKGYPAGLSGTEIPLGSRIISVIDAFDAIVSSRSYRKAATAEEAVRRLLIASGTQFDSEVVRLFVDIALTDQVEVTESV